MLKSRFLLHALVFSLAGSVVSSQEYQISVSTVEVWVKAVDGNGQPIIGLTSDDFEIREDNAKVKITCFEEQTIPGSPAPIRTAKRVRAVSKKFVLFLDLYNTSTREYWSIKPHLLEFINSLSGGGHDVMLGAFLPTGKLGIVSPFTKDLNRIRILLNKAQPGVDRNVNIRRNLDEMNRLISDQRSPRIEFLDRVRDAHRLARTYARQEQQISEYTLQSLEKFAQHMALENLGENSAVVYVSGGFSVDPGRQYYDVISNMAATASTTEEFIGFQQFQEGNLDMRNQIRRTLGKLNKMNVTFYTIDTAGMGGVPEYQDSLVEMADETGGTAFYNSQNFKAGLQGIITDLNHQYLLCFDPPPHARKGQYHRIKVATRRSGVELRHRKGYTN